MRIERGWPSKRNGRIHVLDMRDGEVAQIVEWSFDIYIGQLVQRYEDSLISLGCPSCRSFDLLFKIAPDVLGRGQSRCFVYLLPQLQKTLYTRLPYLGKPALVHLPVKRDPLRRLEFDDEADE